MSLEPSVHVCVPVLRRYDLLDELVQSLIKSTVQVKLHVIDNGRKLDKIDRALRSHIYVPSAPMGVAQSWNWFIQNVPEERLIVNDDVTFAPASIEQMIAASGDMISGFPPFVSGTRGHAFSCFLIRDSCVGCIGLFDETISPGYAYFEDCDYEQRMFDAGLFISHVDCGIQHVHSATLSAANYDELNEHHKRFLIAQQNYINKWGRLPRGVEQA